MSIKDFADEPFPRGLTAQEWMDWSPRAIERIANLSGQVEEALSIIEDLTLLFDHYEPAAKEICERIDVLRLKQ
jgi:hypothetical protein